MPQRDGRPADLGLPGPAGARQRLHPPGARPECLGQLGVRPRGDARHPTRALLVDYTGQEAQYLLAHGIDLHKTVAGFVTETPVGTGGLME